jgi:hypothetical protein
VQLDGSHHQWFEKRGGKCCLMNMVDEAQGTTLSLLAEEGTIFAAIQLLWPQDRLVKELRLAEISTIVAGNQFCRRVIVSSSMRSFRCRQWTGGFHRSAQGYDLASVFVSKKSGV